MFKALDTLFQYNINPFRLIHKQMLNMDPSQIEGFTSDRCIVVDKMDRTLGAASKLDCHIVNPNGQILLHRAFSVFIFNGKGQMLLQRRAPKKITFPNYLTNACCSHPLFLDNDREEGIVEAAQRRLNFELRIPFDQMPLCSFNYMTRIHYFDKGNGEWGEHEIDYILVLRTDFHINPNPDEISDVYYIPKKRFNLDISSLRGPVSPWFEMIRRYRLSEWWNNLDQLHKLQDHQNIHKFSLK